MIREIFALGLQPHGTISLMVELDQEGFDQLLSSYKYAWKRRNMLWLLSDDVSCMQFVRQALKEAEKACTKGGS